MEDLSIYESIKALRDHVQRYPVPLTLTAPFCCSSCAERRTLLHATAAAEQRAKMLHNLAAQAEEEPEA